MAQDHKGRGSIGGADAVVHASDRSGPAGATKYYQNFMRGMSSAVPSWHEEAACSTHSWYLFELVDYDNTIAEGASFAQLWNFNQRNHELGRSICATCPVKATCLAKAGHEDTRWTMRGGEGPKATIGQTGDRRTPRCEHRKYDPKASVAVKLADLPACDHCARSADKLILPRLASMKHAT